MVTLEENTIKRELAKFPNLGEFNLDNLQIEFIAYISINKINIELANLSAVIDIKAFMSTPQKGLALVVKQCTSRMNAITLAVLISQLILVKQSLLFINSKRKDKYSQL